MAELRRRQRVPRVGLGSHHTLTLSRSGQMVTRKEISSLSVEAVLSFRVSYAQLCS